VGTLDGYYDAHIDLLPSEPVFNLYNLEWPILTWSEPLPPARLLGSPEGAASVVDTLLCAGVRVEGGTVRSSVLSPRVTIAPGAMVEEAVLLDGVEVGRGAVVRRAILDKNVRVPEGAEIGVHADVDRERFKVSDGGVVVIGKGQKVE
jgi:glucose-1-phosphate adenylyltransferase